MLRWPVFVAIALAPGCLVASEDRTSDNPAGSNVACGADGGQCGCSLGGELFCGFCPTENRCVYCPAGTMCGSDPCAPRCSY